MNHERSFVNAFRNRFCCFFDFELQEYQKLLSADEIIETPEGSARFARPGDTMGNASAKKICGDSAVQH